MADQLEKDIAKFNELLPTLAGSEGKFALIFHAELVDVFQSYEDALKAGYEKAALESFLVKKIASAELVSYFTRDITTECRI